MTCDPSAFFEASQQIRKIAKDEACYRSAVSRVYYATYHRCRLYYAALPQLSELMGKGAHEQLINALRFPSKRLTENGRERSEALGKYLRDMCMARVNADYFPDQSFEQQVMEDAFSTADMIFEFAAVTKGRVEAPSSPLAQA